MTHLIDYSESDFIKWQEEREALIRECEQLYDAIDRVYDRNCKLNTAMEKILRTKYLGNVYKIAAKAMEDDGA